MKPPRLLGTILLSLLAALPARAAEPAAQPVQYALSVPPKIDPALPNVLILGDSISMGYTPVVRERLAGKANVYRIIGTEEATVRPKGGLRLDTQAAAEHLDDWLGRNRWNVIHFNWGLHDLKLHGAQHQVPLADYERNLAALVTRLKATQARLIWASTTPVPEGVATGGNARKAGDELLYNAAAQRVMAANGIPVDDLHALVAPRLTELQRPVNVHFTPAGSRALGEQVARAIAEALQTAAQPAGSQNSSN